MAKHEFGIMQNAPEVGKRYDEYEPWKYNCISVDDDYFESIALKLDEMDFYWHTLNVKGKGVAYCGVTLIPPCSMPKIVDAVEGIPEMCEFTDLLLEAINRNCWIIHFGL